MKTINNSSNLIILFPDQLSKGISSLEQANQQDDHIVLLELANDYCNVDHHKQKLVLILAAMRHFAKSLIKDGFKIYYLNLEDHSNSGDLNTEISKAIKLLKPKRIILTAPSEWDKLELVKTWNKLFKLPVEILEDHRFLATQEDFNVWAKGKKQLRMEYFYRTMRKKHNILLTADCKPIGGKWNYDQENRKIPKQQLKLPSRIKHKKSKILNQVIALVNSKFKNNFGDLTTFNYAVTQEQALLELQHFIDINLPNFGDYQDAMISDQPFLYHSVLSPYLNIGLLLPLEICRMAETAYVNHQAPLNAVEGFIRQVLGWREYIRGIYWLYMPKYRDMNYLKAKRTLPKFYWDGKTQMFCIAQVVASTSMHAYSHHIQRLMVTGNFALLAGIDVTEVQAWYLGVYADAFEWVEMPNTMGMSLFGDGGIVASKPYIASGKYINKMSNFCQNCKYDPNLILEENACPFNALYWNFIEQHKEKFKNNQRMNYAIANFYKYYATKINAIKIRAQQIFDKMTKNIL